MQTQALLLGGGRLRWWVHDGVDSMRLCAMRLDWTGLDWNGSEWLYNDDDHEGDEDDDGDDDEIGNGEVHNDICPHLYTCIYPHLCSQL